MSGNNDKKFKFQSKKIVATVKSTIMKKKWIAPEDPDPRVYLYLFCKTSTAVFVYLFPIFLLDALGVTITGHLGVALCQGVAIYISLNFWPYDEVPIVNLTTLIVMLMFRAVSLTKALIIFMAMLCGSAIAISIPLAYDMTNRSFTKSFYPTIYPGKPGFDIGLKNYTGNFTQTTANEYVTKIFGFETMGIIVLVTLDLIIYIEVYILRLWRLSKQKGPQENNSLMMSTSSKIDQKEVKTGKKMDFIYWDVESLAYASLESNLKQKYTQMIGFVLFALLIPGLYISGGVFNFWRYLWPFVIHISNSGNQSFVYGSWAYFIPQLILGPICSYIVIIIYSLLRVNNGYEDTKNLICNTSDLYLWDETEQSVKPGVRYTAQQIKTGTD